MIVYHMGHFGALAKNLLIHFSINKESKCVFLFDTILCNQETINFIARFKERVKEFADVITYSDMEFKNETSTEAVKKHALTFFDNLFKTNNLNLGEAKIYSSFDTYNAFGGYCILKHLPIVFVDAFGTMSKNRYMLNNKTSWYYYDEFIKETGALGFGCKEDNCEYLYNDKTIDNIQGNKINFESLRNNLNEKSRQIIIELYGNLLKEENTENYNLVVFSSGWIMADKKMTKRQYLYHYQQMLDFFAGKDNRLLLKPHPNTAVTADEAKLYFDGAQVIPGYFPSEFLSYLNNCQISEVLSTSSSGVPSGIYGCRYFISFEIFYDIAVFKRLYFALCVEKFLLPNYNIFYHHGLHNKFIWYMQDNIFSKCHMRSKWASLNAFEPNSITIIDNYLWNGDRDKIKLINALKQNNNNAIVIFLDSKDTNNYLFDEYKDISLYIQPIYFIKNGIKDVEDRDIEKIYVFCKDPNTMSLIKDFKYKEYMHYSKNLYFSVIKS